MYRYSKARLQHNRYVDMLRADDEKKLAEDARKKAAARTKAVEQRGYLDTQVAFQARLRRQNAEEIVKDRAAIEADLIALERETQAKEAKKAAVIAREKAQRSAQVDQNRARVARAAADDLAEDKARVKQQMEDARAAEAKKKASQEANKRMLQQVQQDNVVRLQIKAEEMEKARLRDQEMMATNERVAEERERKRLADIEVGFLLLSRRTLRGFDCAELYDCTKPPTAWHFSPRYSKLSFPTSVFCSQITS